MFTSRADARFHQDSIKKMCLKIKVLRKHGHLDHAIPGRNQERDRTSLHAISWVMSPSEVALAAFRHSETGVRTMLCDLEPLSHLLIRCGINLSTRITLA